MFKNWTLEELNKELNYHQSVINAVNEELKKREDEILDQKITEINTLLEAFLANKDIFDENGKEVIDIHLKKEYTVIRLVVEKNERYA